MSNNTYNFYTRNLNFNDDESALQQKMKHFPRRIILVRHGESEVNEDEAVLEYVPNYKIKLIKKGIHQAQTTGQKIKEIVSSSECDENENSKWKVLFYVSPSSRTRETMEEIISRGGRFEKDRIVGVREECRLREQHFGNFQDVEERRKIKRSRNRYGKFFYRIPNGESSADVYDRVSRLWRDMESNKFSNEVNLIIVSHGLTILLLLMKLFNWTVDQFEDLANPTNCEYRVLELGPDGDYSLAPHHQLDQLKKWGLSDEMIEDQFIRARGLQHFLDQKCLGASSDDSSDDNMGDYGDEK